MHTNITKYYNKLQEIILNMEILTHIKITFHITQKMKYFPIIKIKYFPIMFLKKLNVNSHFAPPKRRKEKNPNHI